MNSSPPAVIPPRHSDAHKGDFGRALLIGGSRGMGGSIAMSAVAALRSGAGLVTAAVPDRCLETVAGFHPCVMTLPMPDDPRGRFSVDAAGVLAKPISGASAIGCGPGMTTEAGSIRVVERLLSVTSVPRLLDADAINALATLRWADDAVDYGPLVLTPHPGELARLTGVPPHDSDRQIQAAKSLSERANLVIVVKGGPTQVIGPKCEWTNTTGNPGMATAGSGDVLTGVITSFLGQGLSPWDAACLGVWVHGLAGDIAAREYGHSGMTAAEILDALPQAVQSVIERAE